MNAEYNLYVGLILSFVLTNFAWLVWIAARRSEEYDLYKYVDGDWFTTKKAVRIFGVSGERVSDLKYVAWIASLWRTTGRVCNKCYIVTTDELSPQRVKYVTTEDAKKFIMRYAEPKLANALIRDWFGERCLI